MQHLNNKSNLYTFLFILSFAVFIFNEQSSAMPSNSLNQLLEQSSPVGFKSVSAGFENTCAISTENKLYCWGDNSAGQLGIGSKVSKKTPTPVNKTGLLGNLEVNSVSIFTNTTCAINSKNVLYCWGSNSQGTLGNGSINNRAKPILIKEKGLLDGEKVFDFNAGGNHNCAINSKGKLYCWGWNGTGQLGHLKGGLVPNLVNKTGLLGGSPVRSVNAGSYHTCAINSKDQLYCWGDNTDGQLGTGLKVKVETSTPKHILNNIYTVSTGHRHTCVINNDQDLYCWGNNEGGQLGNGSDERKYTPTLVNTSFMSGTQKFISVSTGDYHTCAINTDEKLFCWGWNEKGQLGNGTTIDSLYPILVNNDGLLDGYSVNSVSAGAEYTCAINAKKHLYCWGKNENGQLGTGTRENRIIPTDISNTLINDCSKDPNYSLIGKECNLQNGNYSINGRYYCDTTDDTVKCRAPQRELCNGLDDDGDGVIDNDVILINNKCYKREDIDNFNECNSIDSVVVNRKCYKRSDYNDGKKNLINIAKKYKQLPPFVIVWDNKKVEIGMVRVQIGPKQKVQILRKIKISGIVKEKPKLRIFYNYTISKIKNERSGNRVINKIVRRNNVKVKGLKPGNYKVRYRVVIQAIVNKKPIPVWSNKFSDASRFTITKK